MARDGLTEKQRYWQGHVEACATSGVSMRIYAERHELDVKQFYAWKAKLKQLEAGSEQEAPSFIRASVGQANVGSTQTNCAARVALANGITIEVPANIATDELSHLIAAAMRPLPACG